MIFLRTLFLINIFDICLCKASNQIVEKTTLVIHQSMLNSLELDRDIKLEEKSNKVRILHREKRTIFGFLSFLVLVLNALLAINLNVNINNNNNNLNDNMNMNMNENMNMNTWKISSSNPENPEIPMAKFSFF